MPKLKTIEMVESNKAGENLRLTLHINVSAAGEFYTSVPLFLRPVFVDAMKPIDLGSKTGVKLWAKTLSELIDLVRSGVQRYLQPEITVEHVICYNIESHALFAVHEFSGYIEPNATFKDTRWVEDREAFGDHHRTNQAKGGYSLTIGAKAMTKRTTRFGEKSVSEYLKYDGPPDANEWAPARLLNSWVGFDLGDKAKEIPYSDDAARFFHELMLGMAEINRFIQSATRNQGNLLRLIESGKHVGLLAHKQNRED